MLKEKELTSLSVIEISSLLKSREISACELTEAYIERTEELDKRICAYITFCKKNARECAKEADRKIKDGDTSPLCGIPFSLKDNICTRGIKTSCASRMLDSFVPPYDATVAKILKESGGVLIGKTNMDEFGMGSYCENSALKRSANPINPSYVTGGSSGGSASSVASGMAAFSLGSDTGGSVRLPASFCGLVGLLPTYGAISRYGLTAFASSLDRIGPITRNVKDSALVFSSLCIKDKNDATSVGILNRDFLSSIDEGVFGKKIAFIKEFCEISLSPSVDKCFKSFLLACENLGALLEEVSAPSVKNAVGAYYIISSAEASSNLARFDGVRFGKRADVFSSTEDFYKANRSGFLGEEVKNRIILGTFVLSGSERGEYYKKALEVREKIKHELTEILNKYDYIISPVFPSSVPLLEDEKKNAYENDIFNLPASLAHLPAIAIPFSKDENGMPIGIQIIGKPFGEKEIFKLAYSVESLRKEKECKNGMKL